MMVLNCQALSCHASLDDSIELPLEKHLSSHSSNISYLNTANLTLIFDGFVTASKEAFIVFQFSFIANKTPAIASADAPTTKPEPPVPSSS